MTNAQGAYISDFAVTPDGKTIVYGTIGALTFHDVQSNNNTVIRLADMIDKRLADSSAVNLTLSPDGRSAATRLLMIGGRQVGAPKVFGDEEIFIIPREGKATWFQPGIEVYNVEWLKGKQPVLESGPRKGA